MSKMLCGAAVKGILVLVPFDRPFDRLTVLSRVEGLRVLSSIEGPFHDFRTHGGGLEKRSPCPDIQTKKVKYLIKILLEIGRAHV